MVHRAAGLLRNIVRIGDRSGPKIEINRPNGAPRADRHLAYFFHRWAGGCEAIKWRSIRQPEHLPSVLAG
ncbi:hypothetical protein AJ88_37615 [Mesorhizobium amorphae CCBAU 01583]|nr:hypothetical protein AJ88_37615 [Mesorhizobium amorphae CCBAU 01583]